MTTKLLNLDEIKDRTVEELLRSVTATQQISEIVLPDGEEVIVQPKPPLEQLSVLEGYIPTGGKDAVYKYAE